IDDLDLTRAAAEARERVDEPLQRVLRLDDLQGVSLADHVRLVVDDEGAGAVAPVEVEAAVQQHTIVLEREAELWASAFGTRRKLRLAIRRAELGDPLELLVAHRRIPLAHELQVGGRQLEQAV